MLDSRRKQMLDTMGVQRWVRRDLPPEEECVPVEIEENSIDEELLDWDGLQKVVSGCKQCALYQSRTNVVFGTGDSNASLMIIGEAPGADEDREGQPFVGRAGGLLTQMLGAIGLSRDEVFIANILKCRPPENRNPSADEVDACSHWLKRQIALINPGLILSVGGVSAKNLLQSDSAVGQLRGQVHYLGDDRTPLVVTYHPAYLLRKPSEKAKAWQDLQLVMSLLSSGKSR